MAEPIEGYGVIDGHQIRARLHGRTQHGSEVVEYGDDFHLWAPGTFVPNPPEAAPATPADGRGE